MAGLYRMFLKDILSRKTGLYTQAKYPHILSLDADEVLSHRLKDSILEVKEDWKYDGYYFNRLTNYCGKWIRHTSWYPARKMRLWDSRKGKWGGINPHDKFKLEKGATKKFLRGDLLHYSYYTINEHVEQINKFSSIVATAYFRENRKSSYFNIVFHPIWRVFRDYFIKLGFLDGFYGLVISVNAAHETFLKYIKLRNLYKEKALLARNRICFFNSVKSWGGGEKWHLDISRKLYSKGYNVLLLSHPHSELHRRAEKSGIDYRGIRVSNLSFLNPIKIFRIYHLLRKENVGTIILNLSSDLKVAGIAAKLAGVRNIIYRRGSAIAIRNTWLNRFLYREVVTDIIANSEETSRTILQNNHKLVPREKIKIIYNGIDLDVYDQLKRKPLYTRKNGEIVIGNAGRLSEEKGQIYMIELAANLKKKGLNFRIIIAGTGKLKSKLRKYAKSLDVVDEVIFLGFVDNIKNFTTSIDIFVLTSLYEGFGYVLVEAMAEKKPVVAFDIHSSAEIIRDGVTGYLVEKANVEDLTRRLEQLMSDKKLRDEMGEKGRRRVEEIFTFTETLSKVEALIRKGMEVL